VPRVSRLRRPPPSSDTALLLAAFARLLDVAILLALLALLGLAGYVAVRVTLRGCP
jgi:hypothetical protein